MPVSPTDANSNKTYLKNISHTLVDREKVILIIDEIYITSRLDYRAQSIVGYAENKVTSDCEVAKTIVTFMISSAFGRVNEVVKLWPVSNVKGKELADMMKDVINFVQDCGFEIICVITIIQLIEECSKQFVITVYHFLIQKIQKRQYSVYMILCTSLKIYGKIG